MEQWLLFASETVAVSIQNRRKRKSTTPGRVDKPTRKLQIGWKLNKGYGFQLVSLGNGGGTHHMDFTKEATLKEVISALEKFFFPEGVCPCNNLKLQDAASTYLATFQGRRIAEDEFPVVKFYNNNTNPVRLYLHTSFVSVSVSFSKNILDCPH